MRPTYWPIPLDLEESQDPTVWRRCEEILAAHNARLEEYARLRSLATRADWAELARRQATERAARYAVALESIEDVVERRLALQA